jgi:hypothetical protein
MNPPLRDFFLRLNFERATPVPIEDKNKKPPDNIELILKSPLEENLKKIVAICNTSLF